MMQLSYAQARLMALATDLPQFMDFAAPIDVSLLSPVILRDYQLEILRKVAALYRAGYRRVLVQLPTGGGKTVLAAQVLLAVAARGGLSQFLVHRKELLDQTSDSFTGFGINHSFVASERPFDPTASTLLAGVATLVNRLDLVLPPNLLLIDEAHHAVAASWATIMAAYPDAFVLGLTATPERLDGKGLDEHFDVMVVGPSVAELIARGFLSRYEYFAPSRPDMSGVRTQGPDWHVGDVADVMDRPALIGKMVDHYLRLAKGEQGIVFAASRKHSRNLAEEFCGRGVRAAHVDGDSKDREKIDKAFRRGELDIMTNVGLFDEGYDVPGIVYVGDGRPTKSRVKFCQKAGRALRVIYGAGYDVRGSDEDRLAAIAAGPKRAGIIADHAGNAFTHGLPDDDYDWSLQGSTRRSTGVNDDADPVRQCLSCYRVYPSKQKTCPGCGEGGAMTAREIEQRDGELEKLCRDGIRAAKAARREREKAERERLKAEQKAAAQLKRQRELAENRACKTFAEFEALGVARSYPEPKKWAALQMQMKTNFAAFRR